MRDTKKEEELDLLLKELNELKNKIKGNPGLQFKGNFKVWIVKKNEEIDIRKRFKVKEGFLQRKGEKYSITTNPITIIDSKFGVPFVRDVFICDENTGATIKTEIEKNSPSTTWKLKPYLLDAAVDAGLFTLIFRQFRTNPAQGIIFLILGILVGFVIGGMFL